MKMKFSLVLVGGLLGSLYAADTSKVDINKLEEQIQNINKELQDLKAQKDALESSNNEMKESINELNDRADETEFQAALSKVKFGLDFSTALSNTNYNLAGTKYHANNKWTNELHLNMNADISENLKFYGRLSMAKNWSQMAWDSLPYDLDAGRNTRTSGPVLYVDRAYLDYYITPSLIATVGRQPGTDGPGSNLRNNALRQSTYPALEINALGDALVLTYKPESLSDNKVALRVAYGKTYQWDQESNKVRDWMGDQQDADANLYYLAAETELPIQGLGSNLLIFNLAYMSDFSLPFDEVKMPASNSSTATTLLSKGVYNLGNLTLANIHFENYNAFGTNLNYFSSFGISKGSSAKAPGVSQVQSKTMFNEKTGYALHLGARYDFTQALKVGYEFFWGSRFWYTMSRPSINDPLNIRMTRGIANDFYVIYQLDRYQFLRLSYTNINNKWSNRGTPVGGSSREKNRADNAMLMYNVKF